MQNVRVSLLKLMMYPESDERSDDTVGVDNFQPGEELDGKLSSDPSQQKLPRTILEVNEALIEEGTLVEAACNQQLFSFVPDMIFQELVKEYKHAEKLYGQTIIRQLTGYDPRYVEKNIRVPEFQRELEQGLHERIEGLKDKGVLRGDGSLQKDAIDAAALLMIAEEFDAVDRSFSSYGQTVRLESDKEGEPTSIRPFKHDRYKDIALKQSITKAIKRNHSKLRMDDVVAVDRESRQKINVVYALDVSGSMKGDKLTIAKKAGVSLAHRAIRDRNNVGLVLFGSQIEKVVPLTKDFFSFVRPMIAALPGNETDIALAISSSTKLLFGSKGIRHVVIITDGLQTTSKTPEGEVFKQVMIAKEEGLSISVVGIDLDDIGLEFARRLVDLSKGRLYAVQNTDDIGGIVITDYAKLL